MLNEYQLKRIEEYVETLTGKKLLRAATGWEADIADALAEGVKCKERFENSIKFHAALTTLRNSMVGYDG